jgi:hypothetical protein
MTDRFPHPPQASGGTRDAGPAPARGPALADVEGWARQRRRKDVMGFLWILLIVVAYVALMRWGLPALGVPT